ncbi:MAG: LysM peptidoglycan-binding domain-containing protein [Deltaproteobacteria bacterium]|nr:LysM peptidoglycan-binding domain-containing protein [Deltaproteobacteria bacterium]
MMRRIEEAGRPMKRTTTFLLLAPLAMLLLGTPSVAAGQTMRLVDPDSEPAEASATTGPSGTIQHSVRDGDTLWDLSESYYTSPWYWPQVWAQNPQISNPHYIYPGDLIRFQPLTESGLAAPGGERDIATKLEPTGPSVGGARVRFLPKEWNFQVYVRYVGFVTDEEIRAAGSIRYSREERKMLGELDEVYIDFERLPRVRPGDRWTILQLEDDLIHPIYKRKLGTKVDILGVVDIRAVTRKVAIGVIVRSYKEINRGALVIPLVPNFRSVKPRPNAKNIRGYIVDNYQNLLNIGQHQIVYIDKGVREGVEVGNRFHVVRRGDGIEQLKADAIKTLPWEPLGEIMIVETRDHHSTGLVLGNIQELVAGDVVEMRVNF